MKKYCEIENSYRNKHIAYFADKNDIYNKKYVVLEKLHGACFRIHISVDGSVSYGTRNRVLESNTKFYDWKNAVSNLNLDVITRRAKRNNVEITLYGELFGEGINKGVEYQNEKRIRFFDIRYNDLYMPWVEARYLLIISHLPIVPVVKDEVSLEDALNFDVESFKSLINKDAPDDNIAEGVVIKPMYEEVYLGHDRFILKKKTDKFKESMSKKKRKVKVADPMVSKWKHSVSEYVTENRLHSLFSKKGEIDNPKQIGEYIKEYMEDVRNDFNKDYPELVNDNLTKRQDKDIFNHSKDVVVMLNKYL